MATAGRARDVGQSFTRKLKSTEDLDRDNMVVALDGTTGNVKVCTGTDTPYAIAPYSTLDETSVYLSTDNKVYKTGSQIGEIPLIRSGQVRLKLVGTVAIGGLVGPAADGAVAPLSLSTVADLKKIIGMAEEASTGKDDLLVTLGFFGAGAP